MAPPCFLVSIPVPLSLAAIGTGRFSIAPEPLPPAAPWPARGPDAVIGFLVGQIAGAVFGVVAGHIAGKSAAQMSRT